MNSALRPTRTWMGVVSGAGLATGAHPLDVVSPPILW